MHFTRVLFARSVWKGPHIVPLPIVRPKPGEPVKPIKTMARAATILPNFIGLKFQVHNGKVYNDVTITEDMVGHKLGEFSPVSYTFVFRRSLPLEVLESGSASAPSDLYLLEIFPGELTRYQPRLAEVASWEQDEVQI
ncbi:MAG: hypothetical protein Q9171_002476 [Xanthocarpia ochracea]